MTKNAVSNSVVAYARQIVEDIADLLSYDREWLDKSVCRALSRAGKQSPKEVNRLFFPEKSAGANTNTQMALSLCSRCEAQQACLASALAIETKMNAGAVYGVYGGVAASTRLRMLCSQSVGDLVTLLKASSFDSYKGFAEMVEQNSAGDILDVKLDEVSKVSI